MRRATMFFVLGVRWIRRVLRPVRPSCAAASPGRERGNVKAGRFVALAALAGFAALQVDAGEAAPDGVDEDAPATEEADDEPVPITLEDMLQQVVTVERRVHNLLDVGVTAFTFDGQSLQIRGVQNLTDRSELAPGLEIGNKQGNIEVWIRGVGSSNNTELGDPAAATHMDGV